MISGIELRWDAQTTCDVAHGCLDADTTYTIDAGALHAGHGACEDLNATIADEL